jgi:uncharacterized membrane protein YheB (UPF0754 family)
MKKVIRLTESDLTRIVKRVINEQKEQELITEGLKDIIKNIKSKFSKKKEDNLESEIEGNLGVDKNSSKEEVIDSLKDFFKNRKEWIDGNVEDKKEWILGIASSLGSVFRLFTYIVLFMGAEHLSDNDPITFLGIATYLFLQTRAKIGNKEFKFRN